MDIDVDFSSKFSAKKVFPEVTLASMVDRGQLKSHNVGVYFQNIPCDALTGFSAIPFKEAEDLGYMKFDFLHLPSVLDYFDSKKDIRTLAHTEPDWRLLKNQDVVEKLFQIHNHFYLVSQLNIQSIMDLADCIALIRPGKRPLLKAYQKDKMNIRRFLYVPPADGSYYYKKPHAIAYAFNIVLQLHLIKGEIL